MKDKIKKKYSVDGADTIVTQLAPWNGEDIYTVEHGPGDYGDIAYIAVNGGKMRELPFEDAMKMFNEGYDPEEVKNEV